MKREKRPERGGREFTKLNRTAMRDFSYASWGGCIKRTAEQSIKYDKHMSTL